jgi:hypothetical protein
MAALFLKSGLVDLPPGLIVWRKGGVSFFDHFKIDVIIFEVIVVDVFGYIESKVKNSTETFLMTEPRLATRFCKGFKKVAILAFAVKAIREFVRETELLSKESSN